MQRLGVVAFCIAIVLSIVSLILSCVLYGVYPEYFTIAGFAITASGSTLLLSAVGVLIISTSLFSSSLASLRSLWFFLCLVTLWLYGGSTMLHALVADASESGSALVRAGITFSVAPSFFLMIAIPIALSKPINGAEGIRAPKRILSIASATGLIPFFIILFSLVVANIAGFRARQWESKATDGPIFGGIGLTVSIVGVILSVAAIVMLFMHVWQRFYVWWLAVALLEFWFMGMLCAGWIESFFGVLAPSLTFNAEAGFEYVVSMLWLMLVMLLHPVNDMEDVRGQYETVMNQ